MKACASAAAVPAKLAATLRPRELAALQANAHRASEVLKVIANGTRLILLCQLAEGAKSVNQLQSSVGISQSAVSQQLAVLRESHVVEAHRSGQSVCYVLASNEVAALMKTLYQQFCTKRH
ncbi:MAG: ArsR/SmtB family transcription factor [Steroidobacteraceae bacterium]